MDPLTSDHAHLDLSPLDEDDGPPVYRSGAGNAFDSWAAFGDAICDADHASSKDKRPPTVGERELVQRRNFGALYQMCGTRGIYRKSSRAYWTTTSQHTG